MLMRYKVLNQIHRYARFKLPQNELDKKALMNLIVHSIKKTKTVARMHNQSVIARQVLKSACEDGLIRSPDLTEEGQDVLERAIRHA